MLIFESYKFDRYRCPKLAVSSSPARRTTQNLTTIVDGNYNTNLSIADKSGCASLIGEKHPVSKKTGEYNTGTYKSKNY
jgi:hypothetical protein